MNVITRVVAAILMILFARRSRSGAEEQVVFSSRAERARAPIVRFIVKHPFATVAALAAAGIVGGAVVMISGIVPIKASSGHWAITAMLLDFSKRRAVSTYSIATQGPPLDDEALVIRGAAHYVMGCATCHGGPEGHIPPVMRAMTPPPPALPGAVSRYTAEELFTIVKHGIKFTGMPAWPVQQRDDEVWAVIAFLRRMPQLSAEEYRRLAEGDLSRRSSSAVETERRRTPQAVTEICSRCHGLDGTGRGTAFPSLAGQQSEYMYASLQAFASGQRFSGVMTSVAVQLSDAMMREVSQYYSGLSPRRATSASNPAGAALGATIAAQGVSQRAIPACRECHGTVEWANPTYPRLAGQHASYLVQQLGLLQRRQRGGSPKVDLMHTFVDRLQPEHIRAVSDYFASVQP